MADNGNSRLYAGKYHGTNGDENSKLQASSKHDLVAPALNQTVNLSEMNTGYGAPAQGIRYREGLHKLTNEMVFRPQGEIHSGLSSSSLPSQPALVDWANVPLMSNTFEQHTPPLPPYSANSSQQFYSTQVGPLPTPQFTQQLQWYTPGMMQNRQAHLHWLSSLATGAGMKRSISETERHPDGLLPVPLSGRPRKKSLGERAYDSEPPQASSTYTDSVDPATRTSAYRGVSYHKRDRKYTARTWLNGKMVHIGMYKSEKMAALMVDLKNLEVLGSACHKKLNFTPLERRDLASELAQDPRCPSAIVRYARDGVNSTPWNYE